MSKKLRKIIATTILMVMLLTLRFSLESFADSVAQIPLEFIKELETELKPPDTDPPITEARYNHNGRTWLADKDYDDSQVGPTKDKEGKSKADNVQYQSTDVKLNVNPTTGDETEVVVKTVTIGLGESLTGNTIERLVKWLNSHTFDTARGSLSTGTTALRSFASFICLKGGQAIGRFHSYLKIDHQDISETYYDISQYVSINGLNAASQPPATWGEYVSPTVNESGFNRKDHLDMVIESDHNGDGPCYLTNAHAGQTVRALFMDIVNGTAVGVGNPSGGYTTSGEAAVEIPVEADNAIVGVIDNETGLDLVQGAEIALETFDAAVVNKDELVGGYVDGGKITSRPSSTRITENNYSRYVYSNVAYWKSEYQNLYEIKNKFGIYNTNIFSYAATFSEKLKGIQSGLTDERGYYRIQVDNNNYNRERTQNAVWAVVGDPKRGGGNGYVDVDSDISYDETQHQVEDGEVNADEDSDFSDVDDGKVLDSKLWEAGMAIDQYESILTEQIVASTDLERHLIAVEGTDEKLLNRPSVSIVANPNSDIFTTKTDIGTVKDSTGTVLKSDLTNGEYYKIGPFKMNNYALAFAGDEPYHVYIEHYSGENLNEYKRMIGGIIHATAEFKTEDQGDDEEGTIIEFGKLKDDEVEIEYTDMNGNATSKGKLDLVTGETSFIRLPKDGEYPFPLPNSEFYIKIKRSVIPDAVYLTKMAFDYRQTKTDGRGWVISSKYTVTKWTRNTSFEGSTPEPCHEWYVCTKKDDGLGTETGYGTPKRLQFTGSSYEIKGRNQVYYNQVWTEGTAWNVKSTTTHDYHSDLDVNVTIDKLGDWQKTIYTFNCEDRHNKLGLTHCDDICCGCKGDHNFYTDPPPGEEKCIRNCVTIGDTDDGVDGAYTHEHTQSACYELDCTKTTSGVDLTGAATPATPAAPAHTHSFPGCYKLTCKKTEHKEHSSACCYSDHVKEDCHCKCPGGEPHSREGYGYYRCENHNHTECWGITWKNTYKDIAKGQTFLALHDAYTEVVKRTSECKMKIRLTTDVRINKFITDVEHEVIEGKTLSTDTTFAKSELRAKLDEDPIKNEELKKENPVFVEYGDTVTYIIRLQNYQKQKVEAKIIDYLPENCELISIYNGATELKDGQDYTYTHNGTKTPTQEGVMGEKVTYTTNKFVTDKKWLIIPGGTADSPGQVDLTVKVKVLDWVDGLELEKPADGMTSAITVPGKGGGGTPTPPTPSTPGTPSTKGELLIFENRTQIITNNIGWKNNDELNVDYMRSVYDEVDTKYPDRPGPVVNLAELDPKKLTKSSDFYALNNYNLGINKYISNYKSPISEANQERGITKDEKIEVDDDTKSRSKLKEKEKEDRPFPAERDDILTYKIRLTNNAKDEYTERSGYGGKKPATQIRPNNVIDEMHEGLEIASEADLSAVGISGIPVSAKLYKSDGSVKVDNVKVAHDKVSSEEGRTRYEFKVDNFSGSDYVLIDPGDYLEYTVYVKVIESNMYLDKLDNEAKYKILTNVNAKTLDRIVQNEDNTVNENMAEQQKTKEWVKMKDLVIAGTVWLDVDKDGSIGPGSDGNLAGKLNMRDNPSTKLPDYDIEYAMQNVVVKLYKEDGTLVRTTATNEKGLYTFAQTYDPDTGTLKWCDGEYTHISAAKDSDQRIDKAEPKDPTNKTYGKDAKLVNYYIEFEYDGLVYKSTEVYANDKNIKKSDQPGGVTDEYKIDSNGYEFIDVRDEFNARYETISYNAGYPIKETDDEQGKLEYDKKYHNGYIKENYKRVMKARAFVKDKNLKESTDNTKLLWLFKKEDGGKVPEPDTEHLKYINLGLEDREDVDLSLAQDVYELKTIVNGEEMIYEYNQNNYVLKEGEIDPKDVLDLEKNKLPIDKEQEKEKDSSGAITGGETENSKAFNSQFFITGYKLDPTPKEDGSYTPPSDETEVDQQKWYEFEYYAEDYFYRVSQYNSDTVREYKGSKDRDYDNDPAINDSTSVLLANATGRESELNTEIKFRIKVTNNKDDNDEPHIENKDIPVYTRVNEIIEYYDEGFVDVSVSGSSVVGFNVKEKYGNNYLRDKEIKVASAKGYTKDNKEGFDMVIGTSSNYTSSPATIDGYDALYIRPVNEDDAPLLAEGESMDILLTLIVEKQLEDEASASCKEIETILGQRTVIAEIAAYSTYYKDGSGFKPAGLVDEDSNPGNFGKEPSAYKAPDPDASGSTEDYLKYFEDDTFKTGIKLAVANIPPPPPDNDEIEINIEDYNSERTLNGFVWDDARSAKAEDSNGVQYIGDGYYTASANALSEARKNSMAKEVDYTNGAGEEKDFPVRDIEAKLVELIRIPKGYTLKDGTVVDTDERIYEDTIEVHDGSQMSMRTTKKGQYILTGYIPGEYIVRFTYGDNTEGVEEANIAKERLVFNGQDYKSTTYQAGATTLAENAQADASQRKSASDITLDILQNDPSTGLNGKVISDAKDDEIRRLEVIGYSETMTNAKNEILKGMYSSNPTALIGNTNMFAETTNFEVRTEKEIKEVTILKYVEHIDRTKITTTIKKEKTRFNVPNIDFGLQYRPELQLSLNKYIKDIYLVTSDESGATETAIVHAVFDEYYGIVADTDMVTGATTFLSYKDPTTNEIDVFRVNPKDSDDTIRSKAASAGVDLSKAKKNADGTLVIAIARTELNQGESTGLTNLQYLPNETIDSNGDGKADIVEVKEPGDKYSKYMVRSSQGFAYIVVDDDIMQGATIKVNYLLTGTNIGETDRVSANLSNMRFKENKEALKYGLTSGSASEDSFYEEVTYQKEANKSGLTFIDSSYSAANTARNALFSEYYAYELNPSEPDQIKKDLKGRKLRYAVKDKRMLATSDRIVTIPDVNDPRTTSKDVTYYGRYLGSTYFTGKISPKEVIAELKFDKILDYIDNDLVFSDENNKDQNSHWVTTTANELFKNRYLSNGLFYFNNNGQTLVFEGMTEAQKEAAMSSADKKLLDAKQRAYNTEQRSNLALSLDARKRDDFGPDEKDDTRNASFTSFLMPRYSRGNSKESFGKITLCASKVLSPEDKNDDMVYENIAEVVQYSSVTGRVTNLATTIGNAKVEDISSKPKVEPNESPEYYKGRTESDTASVEKVTLTPPTGLDRLHKTVRDVVETASYSVVTIIVVIAVCVGVIVIIKVYRKRRIK